MFPGRYGHENGSEELTSSAEEADVLLLRILSNYDLRAGRDGR